MIKKIDYYKKIGLSLLCKVTGINKNFFEVETSNGTKGIVYINETSDYFIKDLNKIIFVGDILYLVLKKIDRSGLLYFSFKEKRPFYLKNPFEFTIELEQNENNFNGLLNFTVSEVKKWKK